MAYKIVYKKSVARDLSKLDKKEASRVINKLEKDLARNASSYPALKGKYAGLRKYRVGNYRVIFAIAGSEVIILRIAHGRDIYKKEV